MRGREGSTLTPAYGSIGNSKLPSACNVFRIFILDNIKICAYVIFVIWYAVQCELLGRSYEVYQNNPFSGFCFFCCLYARSERDDSLRIL
jgi:hypothetical protein